MMRKIFITLIALFLTASASYAVDLKLSGFLEFEGAYFNNYGMASDDTYAFSAYGQEFKLTSDIIVSEETKVTARFDILRDGEDKYIWGYGYDQETDQDANFTTARLYMTHKFPTDTTLKLGKMTGSTWGTTFSDDASGRWRVFVQQETPYGPVIGVLEKRGENGADMTGAITAGNEDQEKDDYDVIFLAGVTKVGLVNVKPLFGYYMVGSDALDGESDDRTILLADLAFDGELEDLGVGFESEFVYQGISFADDAMGEDCSLIGIYINGWYNIEPAKVGMWIAYGSYDEDAGLAFDFEDDFNSTTILGDDLSGMGVGGDDLAGVTAIQLYADVTIPSVEKLTVSPSFTYVMSNLSETLYEDTTAFEFDLDGSYKITDTLTYTAGIAYASISLDIDGMDDPDGIMKLYHDFTLEF